MGGVGIVRAGAEQLVDLTSLKASGLKLRTGVSSTPDLILTRNGHTSAFMLLQDTFYQPCER